MQLLTAASLLAAFNWRLMPHATTMVERIQFGPFELAGFLDGWLFRTIEIWGVVAFMLQIPLTLALVHLDYEMRWYLVTDRSLRIREGLRRVRERTMTFANVQNLTIRQNPLQRFFGIADLRVRSAGGGSTGEHTSDEEDSADKKLHLAVFTGISNASEVRALILEHLKRLKTSGIGAPDELAPPAPRSAPSNTAVIQAAEELRNEAARLRAALAALD